MIVQIYIENVPELHKNSPYFVAVVESFGLSYHSAHNTFTRALAEVAKVGGVIVQNF